MLRFYNKLALTAVAVVAMLAIVTAVSASTMMMEESVTSRVRGHLRNHANLGERAHGISSLTSEQVSQVFNSFDTDRDGALSSTELSAALGDDLATRLWGVLDPSYTGKVTYAMFKLLFTNPTLLTAPATNAATTAANAATSNAALANLLASTATGANLNLNPNANSAAATAALLASANANAAAAADAAATTAAVNNAALLASAALNPIGRITVDFLERDNLAAHHTEAFRPFHIDTTTQLVVRRGQVVTLKITVARDLLPELSVRSFRDTLSFLVGDYKVGNFGNSTFLSKTWGVKVARELGESKVNWVFDTRLYIPATQPVGRFAVSLMTTVGGLMQVGQMIILMNPWSSFDQVFMPNEIERQEYVLEQNGQIFTGDVFNAGAFVGLTGLRRMAWGFHQFEMLDVALKVLAPIPPEDRGNAIVVSRALTYLMNNGGYDRGVLWGRWDKTFEGGYHPSYWTGSRDILRKWDQSGGQPVKYGQCWVFAGVLCTIGRAIGLPTRVVTNFRSAHDTPPYDHVVDQTSGESVWNFHVWNEVWIERADVGLAGAWNAIDATPQEESDGKFQMGPAPLPLVRLGQKKAYDSAFVISEVNAFLWIGQGKYEKNLASNPANNNVYQLDSEDVGRFISTKAPACQGDRCRLDLTDTYKADTNPWVERMSFKASELSFITVIAPERPIAGEPFTVSLTRAVEAAIPVNGTRITVRVRVQSVSYSGAYIDLLKYHEVSCFLMPNPKDPLNTCRDEHWTVPVAVMDYARRMRDSNSVQVTVQVPELKYSSNRQFELVPPKAVVTTSPEQPEAGKPFSINVTFANRLPVPLTQVALVLDTPDFDREARFPGTISPRTEVTLVVHDLVVKSPGVHTIAVSVDTKEYVDLFGDIVFYVRQVGEKDNAAARAQVAKANERVKLSEGFSKTGAASEKPTITEKPKEAAAAAAAAKPDAANDVSGDKIAADKTSGVLPPSTVPFASPLGETVAPKAEERELSALASMSASAPKAPSASASASVPIRIADEVKKAKELVFSSNDPQPNALVFSSASPSPVAPSPPVVVTADVVNSGSKVASVSVLPTSRVVAQIDLHD